MLPLNPPNLLSAVIALSAVACASAPLDVPPESAANPQAHTMPIADEASVLNDDFDPWAGAEGQSADPHAHHHGSGPEQAPDAQVPQEPEGQPAPHQHGRSHEAPTQPAEAEPKSGNPPQHEEHQHD